VEAWQSIKVSLLESKNAEEGKIYSFKNFLYEGRNQNQNQIQEII